MWSFEEDYAPYQPETDTYHHKDCTCQKCKVPSINQHHESCVCKTCVPDRVDRAAEAREKIRKRLVVVNSTKPTKYAEGYFKTQPIKDYGAVPRLMVALARKKPDNGWAWYALAFDRFVCFEAYWPDMTYIPPTTSNTVSTK